MGRDQKTLPADIEAAPSSEPAESVDEEAAQRALDEDMDKAKAATNEQHGAELVGVSEHGYLIISCCGQHKHHG